MVGLTVIVACGADGGSESTAPHTSGAPPTSAPNGSPPAPDPAREGDASPAEEPGPNDGGVDAEAGPNKAAWLGAARCANAGLAFCDSFEGAVVDGTKWTIENNGANTVSIDTQQKARGNKSLKLHLVGSTNFQYAWLSTTKVFPALGAHVFGRMFYRVEKLPTKNMHWTTIEITGPLANGNTALLRYGGEYDNFMANYVANGGETAKFSKTPVPVATWTCLEWEYQQSNDTMRLWADETLIADVELVNDPKWVHPVYEKIYVGWQNYQPNLVVPMNVWVDEVALDGARIGCTK